MPELQNVLMPSRWFHTQHLEPPAVFLQFSVVGYARWANSQTEKSFQIHNAQTKVNYISLMNQQLLSDLATLRDEAAYIVMWKYYHIDTYKYQYINILAKRDIVSYEKNNSVTKPITEPLQFSLFLPLLLPSCWRHTQQVCFRIRKRASVVWQSTRAGRDWHQMRLTRQGMAHARPCRSWPSI